MFASRQHVLNPTHPLRDASRLFLGIALVGGVTTSALAFLVAEFSWRRRIPAFYPEGHLDREGVLRLSIVARLGATFLLTAVLPLLVLLTLVVGVGDQFAETLPADAALLWGRFVRAHVYVVVVNGVAATVMALLVARFINRPIQALRRAMARVAAGDLGVRVPVRSLDELGELNEHFNTMVDGARARRAHARAVRPLRESGSGAQAALERGVELDGEVVLATAMFADLRGFTALVAPAAARDRSSRVLERVLRGRRARVRARGRDDHAVPRRRRGGRVRRPAARRATTTPSARCAPRWPCNARCAPAASRRRSPLEAGIGICTGYMIAGNVRGRERVIYTIVGDAVNQAARLQVKTRELGAPILLTESTCAAPDPRAGPRRSRPCGQVALRGILDGGSPSYAARALTGPPRCRRRRAGHPRRVRCCSSRAFQALREPGRPRRTSPGRSAGTRVGLAGPNGAGKSTLLKIVAGQLEPDAGAVAMPRGTRVGYLPQHILGARGVHRAGDHALTAFAELHALEARRARARARARHRRPPTSDATPTVMERYMAVCEEWDHRGRYDTESEAETVLRGLGFARRRLRPRLRRVLRRLADAGRARHAAAASGPTCCCSTSRPTTSTSRRATGSRSSCATIRGTVILVAHDRYFLDVAVERITEVLHGRVTDYPTNYSRYLVEREKRLERRARPTRPSRRRSSGSRRSSAASATRPRRRRWCRAASSSSRRSSGCRRPTGTSATFAIPAPGAAAQRARRCSS